jgi:multicomponent Na+:H+ antiporter subunit C
VSTYLIYAVGGALIFSIGTYALLAQRHIMHKVIGANIMGSGIFMVLIALGKRTPDGVTDPVPQAMVLTGIVVTVALTALGLSIAKRYYTLTGLDDLDQDPPACDGR